MPAHVRLLSYFSNFILLASFLGIGVGCLLAPARIRLFAWFPLLQAAVIAIVYFFKLEVDGPDRRATSSSRAARRRSRCWSRRTLLLPVLFVIVAALFATVAQRMAREMSTLPPLRAYTINILGSLAGVVAFAVMSWRELSPIWWFGVAFVAVFVIANLDAERTRRRRALAAFNFVGLLTFSLGLVGQLAGDAIWSPYYKIGVQHRDNDETVVEVNNIFHQSIAPVDHKEYFYQWPYMAFGNTFKNVLILGAGSGTDVAAALRHGVEHVDAVEIDPVIIRLGKA